MRMRYYSLHEKDQPKDSWVVFNVGLKLPKRPRSPEIPIVVHRLLGHPPEAKVRMKPGYLALCCNSCGRYDPYQLFEQGFDDPVSIRVKGVFLTPETASSSSVADFDRSFATTMLVGMKPNL